MLEKMRVLSSELILQKTFLTAQKKFALVYPKQYLKFAMVITEICFQKDVIKIIQNYPSSIGR